MSEYAPTKVAGKTRLGGALGLRSTLDAAGGAAVVGAAVTGAGVVAPSGEARPTPLPGAADPPWPP